MAETDQGTVLRHQSILELWASVAAHKSRNRSASHNAAGKHAPSFSGDKSRARLQKRTVAKATNVCHGIFVARFVSWVAWAFQIDHDNFPAILVCVHDRDCFLLLRNFSHFDASKTLFPPSCNIFLHRDPPNLTRKEGVGFVGIPVTTKKSDVALEEQPAFPSEIRGGLSIRHYWDPSSSCWRW